MATSLLFPQVYPVTLIGEKRYLSILKDGIKKAFSNTLLVRVFLYSAIVYVALGMLDEYDQIMLSSWFNMPNSFIGIWLAIAMGISSLSGLYAHKLKNMGWKLLNIMAVVTGILLIIISLSNSPLLFPGMSTGA